MTANNDYQNKPLKRFSVFRIVVLALFTAVGTSIGWAIGMSMFLSPQLAGIGTIYFTLWGIAMIVGGVCGSLVARGLTKEERLEERTMSKSDLDD